MRLKRIDCIRALAIIAVVFGHSIIIYSPQWSLYTTTIKAPMLEATKKIIDIIQMPLFFSLSGFLFYYAEKKYNFKDLVKKKSIRLGIPFLVFSLLWMLPIRMLIHYPGYQDVTIWNIIFIKILYGADNGHMWYLPTLFLYFVFSKLIFVVFRKNEQKLIGIEHYLINVIIGGCGVILSALLGAAPPYISCLMRYYIWFSLGTFICAMENIRRDIIDKLANKKWVWLYLVFAILLVIADVRLGYAPRMEFIIRTLSSLFCVITIFVSMPSIDSLAISAISQNSFGIYLFHSPLVYITYTFFAEASIMFVILINFVLFGYLSYVLTTLVRHSKLHILVGE